MGGLDRGVRSVEVCSRVICGNFSKKHARAYLGEGGRRRGRTVYLGGKFVRRTSPETRHRALSAVFPWNRKPLWVKAQSCVLRNCWVYVGTRLCDARVMPKFSAMVCAPLVIVCTLARAYTLNRKGGCSARKGYMCMYMHVCMRSCVCMCVITLAKLLGSPATSTSYDIASFTYPREKSLVTAKNFRGNCRFRGNVRVPPRRWKTQRWDDWRRRRVASLRTRNP